MDATEIKKYISNGLLKIKVVPNASRTELVEENDWNEDNKKDSKKENNKSLKLYLKAAPEKGKANQEVIKFFKKEFGLRVEIKSGLKSREKVLRVLL